MRRTTEAPRPPDRPGITLVEVMVALVLVAVGLLGIAGSSAIALRASAAQAAEHAAIRRATLRLVAIGAAGCARVRDGSADAEAGGTHETWRLSRSVPEVMEIADSIEWRAPSGLRHLVVRSALLC